VNFLKQCNFFQPCFIQYGGIQSDLIAAIVTADTASYRRMQH